MSEQAVFSYLGTLLGSASVASCSPNTGRNTIARTFTNPPEVLQAADFPAIVLSKDFDFTNSFVIDSVGGGQHRYQVLCDLLLGISATPLPELHARALPWGSAIGKLLNGDRTLGGNALADFTPGGDVIASYTINQIGYGGQQDYFGLTFKLPITEDL